MMKRINLIAGLLLFFLGIAEAQLTRRDQVQPVPGTPIQWANLPASPRTGDGYWVDDVNDTCDGGGGSNNVHVAWSGTDWTCLGSIGATGSQSYQQILDIGRTVNNANSEVNAIVEGDGTRSVKRWCDATDGCLRKPDPLADTVIPIWTDKVLRWRDMEASANVLIVDPDAASKNAMYQFGANYKPTITVIAALSPRGVATITQTNVVTNQPKTWWGTLTDADTDAFDFWFPITKRMEGITTATVRLVGVSDNATPSGNIQVHCAMKAYRPGTDTYAAHDTTGEQAITLTPATQNRPVGATSSAITINGTIADGGQMVGSCEVSASGTTSAQLGDFFLWGFATIQLQANSFSD